MKNKLTIFCLVLVFLFSGNAILNAQEIDVKRPASIADGATDAVGNMLAGSPTTLTWTIEELVGTDLNVSAIAVGTTTNCSVSLTDNPTPVVLNSGATATETFDVQITPTAAGAFSFEIDITSDDGDEGNYDITVSGTGIVITPADNGAGISIQPTFEWVTAATGIVVSTDAAYNPASDSPEAWEIEQTGLANVTTYDVASTTTTLLNNTKYYWWVEISTVWTLMGDFTTAINVTPIISTPIAGAQLNTPTVTLDWAIAAGGSNYTYDVFYSTTQKATYAGDAGALQFVDLTNSVLSVTGLAPGVTYYWQVRAKTAAGAIVGYSVVESFVTYGVLSEPILLFPANGSTTFTLEPYLYWTSYSYSTTLKYKVRYSTSNALTGDVLTTGTETTLDYDLYVQLTGLNSGTLYYWQVAVTNDGGSSYAWSDLFSFTTPASTGGTGALAPPTPTYPTAGITVYSSSVTFYWQTSSFDATLQYQLQYSLDNTAVAGVLQNGLTVLPLTGSAFKQVAGLLGDATYFWQVRTYDGTSYGDWSVIETFNTDVSVLNVATPILLTPYDGSIITVLQPTLYWYVAGLPGGYDFTVVYNDDGAQDISGNLTGTSNVLGAGTTSGFFAQFASNLTDGETYYWQVIATKGAVTKYSEVRSFTVNTATVVTVGGAEIPIPTYPVGGFTVLTQNPVLSWVVNSSYSVLEFQVLYSTDNTTVGGVLQNLTTSTSWTANLSIALNGLTPGAVYYWQVKSRLAATPATESDYSSVQYFAVDAGASPSMAILGSPVEVTIGSETPVLSWIAATQSTSNLTYQVEISEEPAMTAAQVIDNVSSNTVTTNLPAGKTYYWRVRSKTSGGEYSNYTGVGEFAIDASITSIEATNTLPTEFRIEQNYPNPFNPTTTIRFALPAAQNVSVKIYDMLGREIATLAEGMLEAGTHSLIWNGRNNYGSSVSTGIYFYQVKAGDLVSVKKMLLMK